MKGVHYLKAVKHGEYNISDQSKLKKVLSILEPITLIIHPTNVVTHFDYAGKLGAQKVRFPARRLKPFCFLAREWIIVFASKQIEYELACHRGLLPDGHTKDRHREPTD
jgi:hypothetical protein